MPRSSRWLAVAFLLPVCLAAELESTLALIRSDSLKGHVSFLASDALEGRGTPSRGQDIAAEYIAAQLRRAGIEPAGDDGYFQTAKFLSIEQNRDGLKCELTGTDPVTLEAVSIDNPVAQALTDQPMVKYGDGVAVAGKVVVAYAADFRQLMTLQRKILAEGKPALLVLTGPSAGRFRQRRLMVPADERTTAAPAISIRDDGFAAKIKDAPTGDLPFRISVVIPAPIEKTIVLRNVVGLLRGSDEKLKDTCVLVTAHYDHLGMSNATEGDRIYNGANDDASGTASVIEIASALAMLPEHPKRTIVFALVFGEEMGMLGSRYYARHPVMRIARTVADVNLEHMGRTDSNLGLHERMVNFTGFDYSDIPAVFQKAGEQTGVAVVKDEKNSDPYFARSDNQALADAGVPAHTISVSYEFPGYHGVSDEWQKIDYDNMARVDRMVALGLWMMAENPEPPHWSASAPAQYKRATN